MKHLLCYSIALLALVTISCGGASTKGLVAGAILSGEVNFAGKYGDRPIAQAQIQLLQGEKVVADTLSDENGRFRFERVPRGGFDLAISKGEQFKKYSFEEEHSKLLQVDDVSIFVNGRCFLKPFLQARQTVLKGTVIAAEDGAPVLEASVRTYPETVQATTDSIGQYTLESDGFEEGIRYAVIVTQNKYDNEMTPAMTIRLADVNEVPPIKLKARKQESPIQGGDVEHDPGEGKIVPGSGGAQ